MGSIAAVPLEAIHPSQISAEFRSLSVDRHK